MPKFPELDASLGETLDLPVRLPSGRSTIYSVPPADAENWARLASRFTGLAEKAAAAESDDEEVADDRSESALYRLSLGEAVYDQLVADGAGWRQIRACGLTALTWHIHGAEAAQDVWARGGLPKTRSTSTTAEETGTPAADPSTLTPASGSGTTPHRKGRASRGTSSSPAGA